MSKIVKNQSISIKVDTDELKEIDKIIKDMNRLFKLKNRNRLDRSSYFRQLHRFFGKNKDLYQFYEKGIFKAEFLDTLIKMKIVDKTKL